MRGDLWSSNVAATREGGGRTRACGDDGEWLRLSWLGAMKTTQMDTDATTKTMSGARRPIVVRGDSVATEGGGRARACGSAVLEQRVRKTTQRRSYLAACGARGRTKDTSYGSMATMVEGIRLRVTTPRRRWGISGYSEDEGGGGEDRTHRRW